MRIKFICVLQLRVSLFSLMNNYYLFDKMIKLRAEKRSNFVIVSEVNMNTIDESKLN